MDSLLTIKEKLPKPCIVMVDDDQNYLTTAKELIEIKLQRQVRSTTSLNEAREIVYKLSSPAVLLVDYHMPGINGIDFLKELKAAALFAIEGVIVTGETEHEILAKALRAGFAYFAKKGPYGDDGYNVGELYLATIEHAESRLEDTVEKVTDTITGAYTRRGGLDMWSQVWNRAARHGTTTACIALDINDFKMLNDKYGHLAGNIVLNSVEKSIRQQIRATDVPVRIGDEFEVYLENIDLSSVQSIARRIEASIGSTPVMVKPGVEETISVSVGVAVLEPHDLSPPDPRYVETDSQLAKMVSIHKDYERLAAQADAAMYASKYRHYEGLIATSGAESARNKYDYYRLIAEQKTAAVV